MDYTLVSKKRQTRPEGYFEIDKSSQLTHGLVSLILAGQACYSTSANILLTTNGSINKILTPYGIATSANTRKSSHSVIGNIPGVGSGNLSDFTLVYDHANNNDSSTFLYGCGTYNGTSNGTGITVEHSSISNNWGAVDIGSNLTDSLISAGEQIPTGLQLLFHTRDGTNHKVYRNGVLKATAAGTNGDASTTSRFIQNNLVATSGTFSTTDKIIMSGRFNYALSQDIIQEISGNPWALFSKTKKVLYFSTGSANYTKTATLNSMLQKMIGKTVVTDSFLLKQAILKNTSIQSQLQKTTTKTSSADASLLKSISRLVSADSKLLKSITATTDLQSQLSKTFFDYTGFDSKLLKSELITSLLDSKLLMEINKTISADAKLQKLVAKINSLDAQIQKTELKSASLGSTLQKQLTLLAGLDSILTSIGAGLLFASIDAKLQKQGLIKTSEVDSKLSKAFLLSGAVFDSKLSKLESVLSSLDSYLISISGKTVYSNLNAQLQKEFLESSSIDGLISKTISLSSEFSAYIILNFNLHSEIDSLLQKALSKTVSFSAYIRALIEYIDVYIDIQVKSIDNNVIIKSLDSNLQNKR